MADIFATISKDSIIKSIKKAPSKGVKDLNVEELTSLLESNEKLTWAEKVASVKKTERKVINKTKKEEKIEVEAPKAEPIEETVEPKEVKAPKGKKSKGKAKGKVKLKTNYVDPLELDENEFNEDA